MSYLLTVGFFCCVLLANDVYSLSLEDVHLTSSVFQELLVRIREQDAKIATLEAMVLADRKDYDVRMEQSDSKIKVLEDTVETLKKFILKSESEPSSDHHLKMFPGSEKNHKTVAATISRPLEDHATPDGLIPGTGDEEGQVKAKRAAPGAAAPGHIVAFHAYLSSPDGSTDKSHTIVFDTVITNAGTAYNKRDGLFTAPSEGVYVFNWVVYSQHQGDVIAELVVNASSRGCSRADSHTLDEHHSASGTVVVHLSQGDVVSVKTHSVWASVGGVMSFTDYYKSSFSGWLLV